MARDGGQQHKTPRKAAESEQATEVDASDDVAERKEKLADDVDAILDEIDEVLESNAEEFVRGFVQKGGE
ncbi:MAG TPA: ubiquitin-like protein Pup [Nocardioidaceae bacterium]|jgi:ubiquitin-like protein Pup|nr:ubiquitin-like protein Pup [Actinomycetota bacterium]MDQ3423577.1 ubiquitin-like protein Pup [Actinomycetota bacterium]HEV8054937.1 ubiquitin-like protein Pup [Nocardioidaceae bacterium]